MYQIGVKENSALFLFNGEELPATFEQCERIVSAFRPIDLANQWLKVNGASIGLKVNGINCSEDKTIPIYIENEISEISFRGLNIKTLLGSIPVIKI